MAKSYGPNLNLIVSADLGEEWFDELKLFLRWMDFFATRVVKTVPTWNPPGSPADGDTYILGTVPTGAWAGHAKEIARYNAAADAWEFMTPKAGWAVFMGSGFSGNYGFFPRYYFDGSDWQELAL